MWPNPVGILFANKGYWHVTTPIDCDYFHSVVPKVSNYNRDQVACKTQIYYLALYGKYLQTLSNTIRRRQWHPTPVLLPGKFLGWWSRVSCSSWGRYESDTTERFHFHFSLSCIGEGNGNPLQCSCLENPRDGGA